MKNKTIWWLLYCFVMIGLASCQKKGDWTCTCDYKDAGVAKSRTYVLEDRTKKKAKENCNPGLVFGTEVTDVDCRIED